MMPRAFKTSTGRDWSSWPVLMMLATVLVPSLGVVWMMRAAMDSERLAVRQRLADAYQVQLKTAGRQVVDGWQEQLASLGAIAEQLPAAEAFSKCIEAGKCDSVVILDGDGKVAYPSAVASVANDEDSAIFLSAERKEFGERDLAGAAAEYGRIAMEADDESIVARAEQAQARCLLQLGKGDEAIEVLERLRLRSEARDSGGRSLAADAELRLLEVLDPQSPEWQTVAESLTDRLQSYAGPALPADQRLFLMHRLIEAEQGEPFVSFPTLEAEELAATFLAADAGPIVGDELRPTAVDNLWSLRTSNQRVLALYRTASIESRLEQQLRMLPMPAGVAVEARRPGEVSEPGDELGSIRLPAPINGWRLVMRSTGGQVFDDATTARQTLLAWVAGVLLAVTLAMTWVVFRAVQRQMQTARLKNDLVATVSHELKTPLASIRLLVDTLLEGDAASHGVAGVNGQGREYLQMISRENSRLTRLIDNFLTFSRMDRGKHRFEFESVDAQEIVSQAVAAVSDRFDEVENGLVVEVSRPAGGPDLRVRGDVDALVTAVVNLLDNALKYSGEHKRVRVSAQRAGDNVTIAVEDNGVGLSPRAAKRVFERFYQVDQRLARTQGGCGLGLSIVRFIVEAHGGMATVTSQVGEGCRFVIALPAEERAGSGEGSDWSLKRPVRRGDQHVGGGGVG
jgi:signal transduction histidine kinase